jgi:hypothetical protein
VIAIGEPLGLYSQGYGAGTYESWRGLTAVVKALRPYTGAAAQP